MTDTILYSKLDNVGRLVLNNPARHNALGREQLDAIRGFLDIIASDAEIRVLVVTGAGDKTFCAGASLGELQEGSIGDEAFQAMTCQLSNLAIPTVCAMNGNVFGGGVELALSCDFRIGVEGSRMRVPAAELGLCYPLEGIHRFLEALGPALTKRILVAADAFDDTSMLSTGVIDYLVPREELAKFAESFAHQIAGLAPLAVQSMKGILRQAASGSIDLEYAKDRYRLCLESEDLQEGFNAKREKREPRFRGC